MGRPIGGCFSFLFLFFSRQIPFLHQCLDNLLVQAIKLMLFTAVTVPQKQHHTSTTVYSPNLGN